MIFISNLFDKNILLEMIKTIRINPQIKIYKLKKQFKKYDISYFIINYFDIILIHAKLKLLEKNI